MTVTGAASGRQGTGAAQASDVWPRATGSGERPEWTVLVPAFNEAAGLATAVRALLGALIGFQCSYEVLIVNDGSRDDTGRIADDLAASEPGVRVIHHSENRGIGAGLVTGIRHARGQWLILIPADLAIDLEDLALYRQASHHADIVVGVRSDSQDYSPYRRLVSRLNVLLAQRLFGLPLRQLSYISLYRLEVLSCQPIRYWRSAFFFTEILVRARDAGYRLREVDVRYVPRRSGRASGARLSLVARTACDLLRFWLDWRRKRA